MARCAGLRGGGDGLRSKGSISTTPWSDTRAPDRPRDGVSPFPLGVLGLGGVAVPPEMGWAGRGGGGRWEHGAGNKEWAREARN